MSSWLSQVIAVVLVTLRGLPQRVSASAVAVVGIAGVVVVFVSVLSVGQGFRVAMTAAGDPRTAIVMRAGSSSEMSSGLTREEARLVSQGPGILRGPRGPIVSAELSVIVNHPKRTTRTLANIPLRGVEPAAFAVRSGLRVIEGRRFEPGRHEIIVGRAVSRQIEDLAVGRSVRWGTDSWTVVGIFESGGIWESEIWCDAAALQSAYRRTDTFNAVYVRLEAPDAFEGFKAAVTKDPRVDVMVVRETDFFAEQSAATARLVSTVGFALALLMATGAVFGAVNTVYAAVVARTREIATLRALGFDGAAVALSVLAESALLATMGGLLGASIAWALLDGYRSSTLNWQTYTQVAFAFAVTPGLVVKGVASALLIGLFGGIPPAVHAARRSVAAGLRGL